MTSRWITIESIAADGVSPVLSDDDLDAVVAQVPILTRIVPERISNLEVGIDNLELHDVRICGTNAAYAGLLTDRTCATVTAGRFLDEDDGKNSSSVIVLSESLARKLFSDANAVNATVILDEREFTVVGLISDGIGQDTRDIVKDAYIPIEMLRRILSEADSQLALDRIRCKFESLDEVTPAKEIIENIMKKRLREGEFRVR